MPRSIKSSIPQDLETICLKALEKDPDRRYQTAGEMASDLREYLQTRDDRGAADRTAAQISAIDPAASDYYNLCRFDCRPRRPRCSSIGIACKAPNRAELTP